MAREKVDALFFSYYEDIDKWHNDHLGEGARVGVTGLRPDGGDDMDAAGLQARMLRQSVSIDGHHYDFARFLSWARHGTTAEYRRYTRSRRRTSRAATSDRCSVNAASTCDTSISPIARRSRGSASAISRAT